MEQKKSRISKLKVGIATVAVAALLVIPAGASEHDSDDDTVTFNVNSGELTVALSGGNLTDITASTSDEVTTGSINVGVEDARGGDGVWDVSLEAEDFVGADTEPDTIPASGLSITGNENLTDDGDTDNAGNVTLSTPSDFSTATEIASGDGANGNFSWDPQLELAIPAGTSADEYSSTLTLTSMEFTAEQ